MFNLITIFSSIFKFFIQLSANCTVYARLYDGTNTGSNASLTISNIDTTAPTGTITLSGAGSSTSAITLTATITASDSASGVASVKYIFNSSSSSLGTTSSSYTSTMSGTTSGTITKSMSTAGTYYLHILITDNAGNKKEVISSKITLSTSSTQTLVTGYYRGNSANGCNWACSGCGTAGYSANVSELIGTVHCTFYVTTTTYTVSY